MIFDRSWYNRAGVERVIGFCSEEEATRFLSVVPQVEKALVDSGILLFKLLARGEPRRTGEASEGADRRWSQDLEAF